MPDGACAGVLPERPPRGDARASCSRGLRDDHAAAARPARAARRGLRRGHVPRRPRSARAPGRVRAAIEELGQFLERERLDPFTFNAFPVRRLSTPRGLKAACLRADLGRARAHGVHARGGAHRRAAPHDQRTRLARLDQHAHRRLRPVAGAADPRARAVELPTAHWCWNWIASNARTAAASCSRSSRNPAPTSATRASWRTSSSAGPPRCSTTTMASAAP